MISQVRKNRFISELVKDITDDKTDIAAQMVAKIMKDDTLRNDMAQAAIEKSKN